MIVGDSYDSVQRASDDQQRQRDQKAQAAREMLQQALQHNRALEQQRQQAAQAQSNFEAQMRQAEAAQHDAASIHHQDLANRQQEILANHQYRMAALDAAHAKDEAKTAEAENASQYNEALNAITAGMIKDTAVIAKAYPKLKPDQIDRLVSVYHPAAQAQIAQAAATANQPAIDLANSLNSRLNLQGRTQQDVYNATGATVPNGPTSHWYNPATWGAGITPAPQVFSIADRDAAASALNSTELKNPANAALVTYDQTRHQFVPALRAVPGAPDHAPAVQPSASIVPATGSWTPALPAPSSLPVVQPAPSVGIPLGGSAQDKIAQAYKSGMIDRQTAAQQLSNLGHLPRAAAPAPTQQDDGTVYSQGYDDTTPSFQPAEDSFAF